MKKNNIEPSILLDSDVIRHFICAGRLMQLPSIYPGRLIMLDKVKNELCRSVSLQQPVNSFLTFNRVPVIPFPTELAIIKEYAQLTKQFGEGESACMAVARHKQQYIASSNLIDIKSYCQQHNIMYLTTMDILVEAMTKNIFTEDECNQFITDVLAKKSKLPCRSMKDYHKILSRK